MNPHRPFYSVEYALCIVDRMRRGLIEKDEAQTVRAWEHDRRKSLWDGGGFSLNAEVRTVARQELDRARENRGATAAYFTLPESTSRML